MSETHSRRVVLAGIAAMPVAALKAPYAARVDRVQPGK